MSDSRLDIERQKFQEWKEKRKIALQNACESCFEHNENCPYFDNDEESWDYEQCYEDRDE